MAEKEKIELEEDGPFTTRLLEAVRGEIELFHDQDNIGYAALKQDGHSEIYRIASREFSNYLSLVAWKKFRKAPMANTKEMITATLEAMAKFEGQERELHVRTAWMDGVLWYDLGGKAVKVTADGWSIIDDPPIMFKRFQHQKEQIEPIDGGSVNEILDFINLPENSEQSSMMKTLLLTYLVAVLIPVIPRPIIIVHGTPGAAKSTFFRLIKSLVDPSTLDTMAVMSKAIKIYP